MAIEWVPLGAATMREARERLGISSETVARRVSEITDSISAKTYERWEKEGRVKRPALQAVTAVLRIEVEEPDPIRVRLDGSGLTGSEHQQLADVLEVLGHATRDLIGLLGEQREVVARLESVAIALQRREAANS